MNSIKDKIYIEEDLPKMKPKEKEKVAQKEREEYYCFGECYSENACVNCEFKEECLNQMILRGEKW